MKRLSTVAATALVGFIAAIVAFNAQAREGCPLKADTDGSYSGRFEGPVSMDETSHVLRVTKDGRPVTGAEVCVNTEMVGMSGMGYSSRGRELAPGRYQIGLQFGMAGDYRGNVVTRGPGGEVSVPLNLEVQSDSMSSSAPTMPDAGMKPDRGMGR